MDLAATWQKLSAEYAECNEHKSTQAQKKVVEQAKDAELVTKGVLTRNQALTRTINRPDVQLKRNRMNRADLNDCLKSRDQERKDDAQKWLLVCCTIVLLTVNWRDASNDIFFFTGA